MVRRTLIAVFDQGQVRADSQAGRCGRKAVPGSRGEAGPRPAGGTKQAAERGRGSGRAGGSGDRVSPLLPRLGSAAVARSSCK